MEAIWKFNFETRDRFEIEMPKGAKILSVQTQHSRSCMWAVVDPDAPKEKRGFRVYGTGHKHLAIDASNFVGTYQLAGGDLVFHLFREK